MSSPVAPIPPLNTFAAPWGPPLISTFLAAVIYGITVLQTFYYYNHYGNSDRISWRILVAVIFVLDTAALALFMYCVYYYLVMSWGIPEMLLPDVREFPSEYVLSAILVFIVQNFYINTIRALRAPPIIIIVLVLTSLTAFVTSLILPAVQVRVKLIPNIVVDPLNHIAFNIGRGTALGCDIGIVAALVWLLDTRKTNIKRADNMINTLIMFTVQRGVLQAIVQAGEVMVYAIKPTAIYFLPFHVIVSRIYCTSLLATLNSREYVAKKGMPSKVPKDKHDSRRGAAIDFVVTSPPTVTNETRQERGRFASALSASGAVFTSLIEPPFLNSQSNTQRSGTQVFSEGGYSAEYSSQAYSSRGCTSGGLAGSESSSFPGPPPGMVGEGGNGESDLSDVEKGPSESEAYEMPELKQHTTRTGSRASTID